MEFTKKYGITAKAILILFIGMVASQCNYKSKNISCDEINEKSASFFNQYYIDSNRQNLDSSLLYTNEGIYNCSKYKNLLSLRKLGILSEQQDFLTSIQFIDTFDGEMFLDLPYFKELLLNRFKAMKAINEGNVFERDKYLNRCVSVIDQYLLTNKNSTDALLKQSSITIILKNPLSTAVTQYYYYKSINNMENVINELKLKGNEENINNEFINYLIDYLHTDFMEFNGI